MGRMDHRPRKEVQCAPSEADGAWLMAEAASEASWYPRQDSNLRTWLRRPVLYPLSYGGLGVSGEV